ncbi:MAG TPA: N-acetylglucosamine-6-phosphate deacetylase, partial [Trueperaceae bacterium]|nr:N-acetylglucosamine-6-phosphate deacetylase [Trueperaceae bacterium]
MDESPRQLTAWTGGRVVLPTGVVEGHAVLTSGSRIVAVCRHGDVPTDARREDLDGAYLLPGLIDIHTHGAVGRSFLDATDEAFETILVEQARHGVTGLLATTSTAPFPDILAALHTTRAWMDAGRPGSRVLGAHVEGPYFAAAQAGAQDPANLRNPDDGSVDELLAYSDVIELVSYAPELPGALELTSRLVALGITAAAGHSEASDAQLRRCEALGLSHAIHLWSGQSTTFRRGAYRVPGILEASLSSDALTGEIIADGKHLPVTLLRLARRCFGPERLCIVSDATPGAGLPDGTPFTMGAMRYVVSDGVGMMLDGTAFAGSSTFLDGMLRVVTEQAGFPLHEAVRMASLTPATAVGLGANKGSLAAGKDADMAVFSPDLQPLRTVIAGRT